MTRPRPGGHRARRLRAACATALGVALVLGITAASAGASTTGTAEVWASVHDGETVNETTPLYAGTQDSSDSIAMSVDGQPIGAHPGTSPPATFRFEASGIKAASQHMDDSIWVNGTLLTVLDRDYNAFDGYTTVTVPIPAGVLRPGSDTVTVRSGSTVSPTDLSQSHDNFTIRNARLVLADRAVITDPAHPSDEVIRLGDGFPGGGATLNEVTANFSFDVGSDLPTNGAVGDWDSNVAAVTKTINPSGDTYVYSAQTGPYGQADPTKASAVTYKTLLAFPLDSIPAGALIKDVTVTVQTTATETSGGVTFQQVTGGWDPDTVTWSDKPDEIGPPFPTSATPTAGMPVTTDLGPAGTPGADFDLELGYSTGGLIVPISGAASAGHPVLTVSYTPGLAAGPHTVGITATGPSGTRHRDITVDVDRSAPRVEFTSPAPGATYTSGDLPITPTVTDAVPENVDTVTGTLDGQVIPIPDGFPVGTIPPGTHTLTITATGRIGGATTRSMTFRTAPAAPAKGSYDQGQLYRGGKQAPVLVASGDIACTPGKPTDATHCQQQGTAALVQSLHPDAVAAIGDTQYGAGLLTEYPSYDASWGAFKDITHPAVGNHEYNQADYPGAKATGYFDYFDGVGAASGPAGNRDRGYYSYDLGAWHIVVLDSECGAVSCATGSGQDRWLAMDLATHHSKCTLAYWHHPLFGAGAAAHDVDGQATRALWRTLYAAGVDLVINGHEHDYERYAPQTPDGQLDLNYGIREIVSGQGGEDHQALSVAQPNLEVANADTFGVLRLTLRPTGYAWAFIPLNAAGNGTFRDQGSGNCHGAPPA